MRAESPSQCRPQWDPPSAAPWHHLAPPALPEATKLLRDGPRASPFREHRNSPAYPIPPPAVRLAPCRRCACGIRLAQLPNVASQRRCALLIDTTMTTNSTPKKIPTHEEVFWELSAGCTPEEAVWKTLKWERAATDNQVPPLSSDGKLLAALRSKRPKNFTLEMRLQALEADSTEALRDALDKGDQAVIDARYKDAQEIRDLVAHTRLMMMEIDDELHKGEQSALRIDDQATMETGTVRINRISLERWLASRFKGHAGTQLQDDAAPVKNAGKPTKAEESLYVTLALAVTALARRSGRQFVKGDTAPEQVIDPSAMNLSAISRHLAEMAPKPAEGAEFPGQSPESIKKRVEEAFRIRGMAVRRQVR